MEVITEKSFLDTLKKENIDPNTLQEKVVLNLKEKEAVNLIASFLYILLYKCIKKNYTFKLFWWLAENFLFLYLILYDKRENISILEIIKLKKNMGKNGKNKYLEH